MRPKPGEAPCGWCGHHKKDHGNGPGEECKGCASLGMHGHWKFRRQRPLPSGYHDNRRR